MAYQHIPTIVKHCAIAIYRTAKLTSRGRKDRFTQSLLIARSRLTEYGYCYLKGDKATDPVGLTPKGRARNMKHRSEGRAKTVLFDTLYALFDMDGAKAKALKEAKAKAEKLLEERTEENKSKFNKRNKIGQTD